jgi:hypothetical protein
MALDKHTFGDAPAAMYLVELLNQRDKKSLTRIVSKSMAESRTLLNDVTRAHLEYDVLSLKSLSKILNMISARHHGHVREVIAKYDEFIADLTVNVLEGSVKTWKRRAQEACRKKQRMTSDGSIVDYALAEPIPGEKGSRELQFRSAKYLERKGKINTLYPDK